MTNFSNPQSARIEKIAAREKGKQSAPNSNSPQSNSNPIKEKFRLFARQTAEVVGSAWTFALAVFVILGWAITGPIFHYSDTWQLVINTATTIVTFLMVFLIQNTQNRDARVVHLKLDELLHAIKGARNQLINLEDLSEEELDRLQKEFARVCKKSRLERGEENSAH